MSVMANPLSSVWRVVQMKITSRLRSPPPHLLNIRYDQPVELRVARHTDEDYKQLCGRLKEVDSVYAELFQKLLVRQRYPHS